MSDYIIITLLTLAVYYPLTLGTLAVMMYFAWRRRRSPYWRLLTDKFGVNWMINVE